MIEAGTVLQDRYRIERQIGQGGMGAVFVATDQRFGSTVAIKETFFEDEKLQKAFEREARLLNSLKHSALPKVIDYFAEEGGQFIVMEFIAGDDLSETMEKRAEPFPLEDVLNWAGQLCDALKYLHDQVSPVIHRDIKPQNLKLTPGGQVILLDFGLAKGNPTEASHKTAAKSIFGYSRSYASLEQIQGTGTDPRSDLYSLAATLYHLLTGIPPADALTRAMNVLNGKPDPLVPANLINHDIPRSVADVIQTSMALNAGERPESASQLKSLLESADKTIVAGAPARSLAGAASTELLSQETQLMPHTTNFSAQFTDDLKTKVSGQQLKDGTGESTVAAAAHVRPRKIIYIGATALSGIFAIAGMAYYMSGQSAPGTGGAETQKTSLPGEGAAAASETNPNPDTPLLENIQLVETDPAATAGQTSPDVAAEPQLSTGQKKKSNDGVAKSAEPINPDAVPEFTVFDEGNRIRVFGDRIETDEMIMDDTGVRWKDPTKEPRSIGPGKMPVPPDEFKKLTPKQQQKLRELMKRQEELRKIERPRPPKPEAPPANN